MANDISTSLRMVQMPSVTAGKETSQFETLETAGVPETESQKLPETGNDLPQSEGDKSVSDAQLREAVGQINNFVQAVQRDLSFSMDEGSGRTIIKVIDSESGEVVRQIPSEEVLAIVSYIRDVGEASVGSGEAPQGLLFSKTT